MLERLQEREHARPRWRTGISRAFPAHFEPFACPRPHSGRARKRYSLNTRSAFV